MPGGVLSPTVVAARVREAKAVDLRIAGHTFEAIADQLGYANASGAHHAVRRAIERSNNGLLEDLPELRRIEDARYDSYLKVLTDKLAVGDPVAVERAIRISKARRELWGLDAPAKVDVNNQSTLRIVIDDGNGNSGA